MKQSTIQITTTHRKGITDLKPEYAFRGIDGSFEPTNDLAFYLANTEWMTTTINLKEPITQKIINDEIKKNVSHNKKYIHYLKSIGEFGKEIKSKIDCKIEIDPNYK